MLVLIIFLGLRSVGTDSLESSLSSLESLSLGLPDGVVGLSSGSLGLLGGLALLLLVGNVALVGSLISLLLVGTADSVEGVKSLHENSVGQRVLLGTVEGCGGLDSAELSLDLVGVDDASEISAVHNVSLENVSALLNVSSAVVAEDVVEGLEGVLGPDDESSEVATRGELEEVKSVDVDEVDAGEVSGGSLDRLVLLTVDDQGAASEDIAGVSHLALADSNSLGVSGSLEVLRGAEVLKRGQEGLGGVNVEVVNNEGELGGTEDAVASGENQGSHGGGSDGGSNSVSLLVGVDLSVPSSVGLEGSEHSTLAALVAEGTLARAGSAGAANTRNTGDSATSSPRLSGVLHASLVEDSVSLSAVLVHVGVNELDNVVSDGSSEDSGEGDGVLDLGAGLGVDADNGSGGHLI